MDETNVFELAKKTLSDNGLKITDENRNKPWGGYLVIDESQTMSFIEKYFPEESDKITSVSSKLSPKFLIVAPGKRLSWQYHLRRSEIWTCIYGKVGVICSLDDTEGKVESLNKGEKIEFEKEERHRLIGLQEWGIVAEIWMHTDPNNPSDEEDIIRLQDDYQRN